MKRAGNEACPGKRTELQELHPVVGERARDPEDKWGARLCVDLVVHLRRESR